MPVLQKKPDLVEMHIYAALPNSIKHILGGPDNVEFTKNIIETAGLTEDFRTYINTVVFGLFVGELNPRFLTQAVKEWLAVDDAKALLVAALIKKTFIDPHQDFLNSLYQQKQTTTLPPSSVPQGNMVDLKNSK